MIKVKVIVVDNQVIHAIISKVGYEDWILSTIYASPNQARKEGLWQSMESIASMNASNQYLPWMAVGDFNDIVDNLKRRGREIDGSSMSIRCNKFVDNINNCALITVLGPS